MQFTPGSPIQIMPAQPGTRAYVSVGENRYELDVIGWALIARGRNWSERDSSQVETDVTPLVMRHGRDPDTIERWLQDETPVSPWGEEPTPTSWEVVLP